jgi:hypothetical protein
VGSDWSRAADHPHRHQTKPTAVNDGRDRIGSIVGQAPKIKALDAAGRLIGTFSTQHQAVAAIFDAKRRVILPKKANGAMMPTLTIAVLAAVFVLEILLIGRIR